MELGIPFAIESALDVERRVLTMPSQCIPDHLAAR
jgi:hypothetical protein